MRRRGPCLTPFAPQRIVTAARAHCGFYKRPRAPPRRPSARVRGAPGSATREAGLAARPRYGEDRARPEGAEAAGRGGLVGVGRATGARARGAGRGAEQPRQPPAPAWDPSNPAPPCPPCRESVPHPSALGAHPRLRRLRRRAGRGPPLQSGWGCCCPGRKDVLSLSGDLTGMLAPSLHFFRRLGAGRPKSACSGGGLGSKKMR